MGSVAEIEIAIQRLSVAEQRIIVRHLGASLRARRNAKEDTAATRGIPFLDSDCGATADEFAVGAKQKPAAKRGRPHATDLR